MCPGLCRYMLSDFAAVTAEVGAALLASGRLLLLFRVKVKIQKKCPQKGREATFRASALFHVGSTRRFPWQIGRRTSRPLWRCETLRLAIRNLSRGFGRDPSVLYVASAQKRFERRKRLRCKIDRLVRPIAVPLHDISLWTLTVS